MSKYNRNANKQLKILEKIDKIEKESESMKEWKVELIRFPLEFFIKAKTEEQAIKKAKARVNFSIYETTCEEVEGT